MFPRLRGQETFVAETFFASEKQKMFLTFFRNILFFNKCFPVCAARKQCFRNSVSAAMFPRLRGPLETVVSSLLLTRETKIYFNSSFVIQTPTIVPVEFILCSL